MAVDLSTIDLTKYVTSQATADTVLIMIIAYCQLQTLPAGAIKNNLLAQIQALLNQLAHL